MIRTILTVVFILMIVIAFVYSPKKTFDLTVKVAKKTFEIIRDIVKDSKPIIDDISTKINKTDKK